MSLTIEPWDPRTTYRVRQLPSHLDDRSQAVALLVRLEPSLGPPENIHMFSLASSANIWDRSPFKTATVLFKALPSVLANEKNEWVLPARQAGYSHNVIIDIHFLDFTVFNDVTADIHTVDCIAISGLSAHAFGSWRSHGDDPNFMWLRDSLPRDIRGLRSMTYGYDTHLLLSSSIQTVDDIARMFIAKLRAIGRSSLSAKPLIFLAHSLGGIILKRALCYLADSGDAERFILDSVRAIVLFGVPCRGMRMSHLLPIVEGRPNEPLVRVLAPDSAYLRNLEQQFSGISNLRRIRLISAYETGLSKTFQKSANGDWAKIGPEELLVMPDSAITHGSKESDKLPINRDHSNIVKFAEDDLNYGAVLQYLKEIAFSLQTYKGPIVTPLDEATEHQNHDQLNHIGTEPQRQVARNRISDEPDGWQSDMLESLRIDEYNDRLDDIKLAHEGTFSWVYTNENISFSDWLLHGSGIYWINGRPGSGKSTLMKFIWNNDRTEKILQERSHSENQIKISFFFHNRGTHLQKSFEGLYRSIIFQILSKAPELRRNVPAAFRTLGDKRITPWTLAKLERLFRSVLEQKLHPVTIILFLDALDEYDGSPEAIADFVTCAIDVPPESATRIQICFSSRPWNHFIDKFHHHPGFAIHDHTREDIRKYSIGRLGAHPEASDLFYNPEPGSNSSLVDLIVERANGVFLWVRLIMDQIMTALTNGAHESELIDIISSLPDELEDLYRWTINRISRDQQVRLESYIMFEIVLRAYSPMAVAHFAAAVECATGETVAECKARVVPSPRSRYDRAKFSRRLRYKCGGLVEIIKQGRTNVVQFMHQTVKDFVNVPGFREAVLLPDPPNFLGNGFTFLSKYMLVLYSDRTLDSIGPNSPTVSEEGLVNCTRYAFFSEETTGKSNKRFLDSLDDDVLREAYTSHVVDDLATSMDGVILHASYRINSLLSFAVVANLRLYVSETLTSKACVNRNPGRSLLHCAVEAASGPFDMESERRLSCTDLSEMVNILLSHDADMQARYDNRTAFETLCLIHNVHAWRNNGGMEDIANAFLSHGQDPNCSITTVGPLLGYLAEVTKPLHLANFSLTRCLIDHGANVNALDDRNETPLDVVYDSYYRIKTREEASEACDHVMLLISNGGCINPATVDRSRDFAGNVRKFFEINSLLEFPPLLEAQCN